MKIELLSTGGTAKLLREEGIPVKDVAEFTGWPEMLGGRVKTLHPKVHGGLLYRRHHAEDQKQAKEHGIAPIDLVVVNLYPFEATAARGYTTAEELIENIDIGGPTMLRSAAKNFESVTVVTDPGGLRSGGRGDRELGRDDAGDADRTGAEGVCHNFALRWLDHHGTRAAHGPQRQIGSCAAGQAARARAPGAAAQAGTALRRKPAPGGGLVCARRAAAGRIGRGEATPGQRAFLQQLRGPGSGAQPGGGIRGARGGDHQAQQSLRRGGTEIAAGCLREGVRVRPGIVFWRGAGVQSHRGRGDRGTSGQVVRGMHRCAGIRGRRAGNFRRPRKICACWFCRRAGWSPTGSFS